ncbi:hypothetical protein GCM10023214_12010 [Amycolatopsis dongchuanensis]|uniref:Uncharacterized protein n=2 Tax=Amycolatopsis dongchuanensis TaxID=1070866 RepID=A0ABP9Q2J9_9PSEU
MIPPGEGFRVFRATLAVILNGDWFPLVQPAFATAAGFVDPGSGFPGSTGTSSLGQRKLADLPGPFRVVIRGWLIGSGVAEMLVLITMALGPGASGRDAQALRSESFSSKIRSI